MTQKFCSAGLGGLPNVQAQPLAIRSQRLPLGVSRFPVLAWRLWFEAGSYVWDFVRAATIPKCRMLHGQFCRSGCEKDSSGRAHGHPSKHPTI